MRKRKLSILLLLFNLFTPVQSVKATPPAPQVYSNYRQLGTTAINPVDAYHDHIRSQGVPVEDYLATPGFRYGDTPNRIRRGHSIVIYDDAYRIAVDYNFISLNNDTVDLQKSLGVLRFIQNKMDVCGRNSLTINENDVFTFLKMIDIHADKINRLAGPIRIPYYRITHFHRKIYYKVKHINSTLDTKLPDLKPDFEYTYDIEYKLRPWLRRYIERDRFVPVNNVFPPR